MCASHTRPNAIAIPPRTLYHAFTLVELLVVIGIIALLISILLPSLNQARQSAKTVACLSNLRQNVQGMTLYMTAYNQWIPGSPNTSGIGIVSDPSQNMANTPTRLSAWDWITPVAEEMGIEFNDGASLGQRQERYRELVGGFTFLCPENDGVMARAFLPSGAAPQQWNSYSTPIAFLFKSPPMNYGARVGADRGGLTNNPLYGGNAAVDLPGGYGPRSTKVGSASTKIILADGARFLTSGGLPSYNMDPRSLLGGDFSDWGSFSKYSRGWERGRAPGNNASSATMDARILWARHGGGKQPFQKGGAYRSNYAFFDGHAESMNDLEGSDPAFWVPVGSRIQKGEVWADTEASHIGDNYVNNYFEVPE